MSDKSLSSTSLDISTNSENDTSDDEAPTL